MANKYQESLLTAIDILVNSRIDEIQMDKTVTATINKCTNALTGEYQVRYSGGNMLAYAQDNTNYAEKTEVYVLVPLGDFTKKKMIMGRAQQTGGDDNISFVASALNNYNIVGTNSIRFKNKPEEVGLHSYLKEDYLLIYQRGDEEHSLVTIDQLALENSIKSADALYLETSFSTRLPKEHRLSSKGLYGITFNLVFKDGNDPTKTKTIAYVIDSNAMTGNPLQFLTWSDQFNIFQIDTENFLYIESIMAFSKDFVTESNHQQAQFYGVDIKLKEFEIYGLKEVTAVNGDYKLKISTPRGNTFKTIGENEDLTVLGRVTHKDITNLSDATTFYWFVEDSRVTSASEEYNMYGGVGWRYLKDKGNNTTLLIKGSENRAYVNKYRCAAVYKSNVILKDDFVIYNEASKRDLSITSSLGEKFSFDRGKPTLTCLVNGHDSDFERDSTDEFPHTDNLYKFVWSKTDQQGNTVVFNRTAEDVQRDIDKLKEEGDINFSVLNYLTQQKIELQDVEFIPGENKITYPVKQISNFEIFTCEVFLKDHISQDDSEAYSIGSAEITLQNAQTVNEPDYTIVIENGDQVFQYTVDGISPKADRNKEPITIKPLSVKFYDPAGEEIDQRTYLWRWLVPLEDTLIVAPKEGMITNPATNRIEHSVSPHYPLDIKEYYDFSALNNQIEVLIDYNGKQFRKRTNLTFSKVGENGTNGTDIVAKVNPLADVPIGETLAATLDKGTLNMSDGNTLSYSIPGWNYGTGIFNLDLFYKNEPKAYTETSKWAMAPSNSWCNAFSAAKGSSNSTGQVEVFTEFSNSQDKKVSANYILRGNVAIDGKDYYGFYNVPLIIYNNGNYVGNQPTKDNRPYTLHIDWDKTLKQVLYNRDGHNPMYNRNQGVFISLEKNEKAGYRDIRPYIVYQTIGGMDSNQNTSEIKIARNQNAKELKTEISPATELADEQTSDDAIVEAQVLGQIEALFTKAEIKIKATTDFYDIDSYWQELDNQMIDILLDNKKYSDPINFPKFAFYYKGVKMEDGNDDAFWNSEIFKSMSVTSKLSFRMILRNQIRIIQMMLGELPGSQDDIKKLQENNKERFEVIKKDKTPYTVALETDITPIEEYLIANRRKIYEIIDHVYVYPDEVYSGEYMNQCVLVSVYENAEIKTPFIQAYIPIYMSLNTYELQSLNAWDGNHIEINEDDNYILAPQIGAGKKNNNNQFTGILMGTAQFYDAKGTGAGYNSNTNTNKGGEYTGLFGFSKGQQSIFLDAETGEATFGLPANLATAGNKQMEGRIELRPGGESKIGNWRIGTNSLYNINDGTIELDDPYKDLLTSGHRNYVASIPHELSGILLSSRPAYMSIKGDLLSSTDKTIDYDSSNLAVQPSDSFELQLDPNQKSLFTIYVHTAKPEAGDYKISGNKIVLSSGSLPSSTALGTKGTAANSWIISKVNGAVPRYAIIAKTAGISTFFYRIELSSAQTAAIQKNGSVTVVISNEHNLSGDAKWDWRREQKVGIDNKGRFYTNSLKNSSTSLTIGGIGAFGTRAQDNKYVGAAFEIGAEKQLFKIFTDANLMNSNTGTVYLSGSDVTDDEYLRPISIHGDSLKVYTRINKSSDKTSTSRLIVSNSLYELGNNDTLLTMANRGNITLKTTAEKTIEITNSKSFLKIDQATGLTLQTTRSKQETITGNSIDSVSGVRRIDAKGGSESNFNSHGTLRLWGNRTWHSDSSKDWPTGTSLSLQLNDIYLGAGGGNTTRNSYLYLRKNNPSTLSVGSSLNIYAASSLNVRTTGNGWALGQGSSNTSWITNIHGDKDYVYLQCGNQNAILSQTSFWTTTGDIWAGTTGHKTFYGHNLYFNDKGGGPAWSSYNHKQTLRDHLSYIYSLLKQHEADIKVAATKANWATINNKPSEFPPSAGSSHYAPAAGKNDSYVKTSTYSTHVHDYYRSGGWSKNPYSVNTHLIDKDGNISATGHSLLTTAIFFQDDRRTGYPNNNGENL